MMTAEERYQRDPAFHAMVDLLEQLVHKGEYTPTELREAVVLAATHYEMRRPRAIAVTPEQAGALRLERAASERR
jgi:hypothetical protein